MTYPKVLVVATLEQGGDSDASYFGECMGELYVLESSYESGHLSPEQISSCRQGLKTKEIIIRLRSKPDSLLWEGRPPCGDLMEKVLRYLIVRIKLLI